MPLDRKARLCPNNKDNVCKGLCGKMKKVKSNEVIFL